jgi:monoamine oxidase
MEWNGLDDTGDTGMSAAAGQGAPELTGDQLRELQAINQELIEMCDAISLEEPWHSEHAADWDRMSVQEFFDSRCSDAVVHREWILAVQTILAEEPQRISLLYLLFFLKANGGFVAVSDGVGGSQTAKVKGGMGGLAAAFAAHLSKQYEQLSAAAAAQHEQHHAARAPLIALSNAVTLIQNWNSSNHNVHVRVHTADGKVWHANRVIIAVPPAVASKITFAPPLPSGKANALRMLPMGAAAKVIVLYRSAFWSTPQVPQAAGDGEVHFTEQGPVQNIFHTNVAGHPGLVGLITGDQAREWAGLSASDRRTLVLNQYQRIYNSDQALEPVFYIDNEWQSDPYSLGCYAGVAPPNYLTRYGRHLRTATDRVFWAGTETATEWPGYFEGAMASGERAAIELLDTLPTILAKL